MIKIVDGLGQLGSELIKCVNNSMLDVTIYHTWDMQDRSSEGQCNAYEKFRKYVIDHNSERIIFISTLDEKYNDYLKYKYMAEQYLLDNTGNGVVMRLPYMIGNGLCQRIRNDNYFPKSGFVEISTVKSVAYKIFDSLTTDKRLVFIHGDNIEAEMIYALINYGAQ